MDAGAWRSLVAHLLWEQGVGGSNPLSPILFSMGCKISFFLNLPIVSKV